MKILTRKFIIIFLLLLLSSSCYVVYIISEKKSPAENTENIVSTNVSPNNILLAQLIQPPESNIPFPFRPALAKAKPKPVKVSDAHTLLSLVRRVVQHISSNHYKLGGNIFDLTKGIYHLDCSEYVDNLIKRTDPIAYQAIHQNSTAKPNSLSYFDFLNTIPPGETRHHWYRVPNLSAAKAGDILIFRYKDLANENTGGHVMIIYTPPKKFGHNSYTVRVSDSAPAGHSTDTRPAHVSGIGIGSLLLKVDPVTQLPVAYAWKWYAPWHTDMYYMIARLQS